MAIGAVRKAAIARRENISSWNALSKVASSAVRMACAKPDTNVVFFSPRDGLFATTFVALLASIMRYTWDGSNQLSWMPYEDGKSLNTRGSENGLTLRDEEHTEGARITLEKESDNAPFALTCGIYGWFFHTRLLGNSDEAEAAYVLMKADLSRILYAMASHDDADGADIRQQVDEAISAFVDRFP